MSANPATSLEAMTATPLPNTRSSPTPYPRPLSEPGARPEPAGERLVRSASEHGMSVAVAESLTGGLVADAIVSVPGASAVFRGAVVAYATELKATLLGVDPELLARVGAVDESVAAQMAQGVAERLGADLGLATTGVAGPDEQDGHPVGTVFVAVARAGRGTKVAQLALHGDRETIRALSVRAVLDLALEVSQEPDAPCGSSATGRGNN